MPSWRAWPYHESSLHQQYPANRHSLRLGLIGIIRFRTALSLRLQLLFNPSSHLVSILAANELFAVNIPGDNLGAAFMAERKTAAHTNRILCGAMNHGGPDFNASDILKQIVAFTLFTATTQDDVPKRAQHQIPTGLQ